MVDFKFQEDLIEYVHYNDQLIFKVRCKGQSIRINLILGEKIIGEATITVEDNFMPNNPCYYIHSVGVLSTMQNMGYGTILMKYVVEWLKKLHKKYGLDYAMLYMTKERLEDKIRFYKRVGFVLTPYESGGITPMFYSFNEKGNEIIKQVSDAKQKYQEAYDNEMSFFTKKAEILTKQELYDLLYQKTVNLQMLFGYEIKTEEKGKYHAYQEVYCIYINDMKNYNWYNIFDALYAKCRKK